MVHDGQFLTKVTHDLCSVKLRDDQLSVGRYGK